MIPTSFSKKQKLVLQWWAASSPERERDALICDGAVRSGKPLSLGLSFFLWAMARFDGECFALCGKTVEAVRRNMLVSVLPVLGELGFSWEEKRSRKILVLRLGKRENTFYIFGGKDEGSAALIQGMTLAGVLLDEVALMPRSFVEQALARCSVTGAKFWFSCNPEGPSHWFYQEWICKTQERNALHLRFFMTDNPALSKKTIRRYERAFHGAFYRRFVLGEWTAAEGLVYDFFDESYVQAAPLGGFSDWVISCDYGTVNPTSMGLWGRLGERWYRVSEYYYDARAQGRQKTDGDYVADLRRLAGGRPITCIVCDPSAASFLEALRRDGWTVRKAKNEVLSGIRQTAEALRCGSVVICDGCTAALSEFSAYCWDLSSGSRDQVKKEFDHAMDEIRYFVATIVSEPAQRPFPRALWSGGFFNERKVGGMSLGIWKRKETEGGQMALVAAPVQLRQTTEHPFGMLDGYTPLGSPTFALYRAIREAVPVVDAAILKLVRLSGGLTARCENPQAERELSEFLQTVKTGWNQQGIQCFLDGYLDSLLTCGRAVGELVLTADGSDIAAVLCGNVEALEVQEKSPLDLRLYRKKPSGESEPLPYQELLLFTPYLPSPENPYGSSLLRSMPFLSNILLKIYQSLGTNWERAGNLRFSVVYKPGEEGFDANRAQLRAQQLASEWSAAMQSSRSGAVRDFVSVGDVEIRVIGAEAQIPDCQVPVRLIVEQLIAQTGIPPFIRACAIPRSFSWRSLRARCGAWSSVWHCPL